MTQGSGCAGCVRLAKWWVDGACKLRSSPRGLQGWFQLAVFSRFPQLDEHISSTAQGRAGAKGAQFTSLPCTHTVSDPSMWLGVQAQELPLQATATATTASSATGKVRGQDS